MRRFTFGLFLACAVATTGCDQTLVSPASVLVKGEHGITAIATDGSFVYWSNLDGSVKRVPVDGGATVTLVAAHASVQSAELGRGDNLKVDAESVYWTTAAAVVRAPKTGGAPLLVAGGDMEPLSDLTGLALDDAGASVYFTHGSGMVRKAPKIPGDMVTLASAEETPHSPVVNGPSLYWATGATGNQGTVRQLALEGGSPDSVPGTGAAINGISVDDSHIYWASSDAVSWTTLAGGTPNIIVTTDFAVPVVVGDVTSVYWSSTMGNVSMAPVLPNASADLLITGPSSPVSLALDVSSLYWANEADGTVMTMPKITPQSDGTTAN